MSLHADPQVNRMLRRMRAQLVANQAAAAAETARAVRRAPSPPRPGAVDLNTGLQRMRAALLAQKRQRALEHEERQLRLLALRMPSVPRRRLR